MAVSADLMLSRKGILPRLAFEAGLISTTGSVPSSFTLLVLAGKSDASVIDAFAGLGLQPFHMKPPRTFIKQNVTSGEAHDTPTMMAPNGSAS